MLRLAVLLASVAVAQPLIYDGGIRNAASYAPPGHLNAGLAQGALAVIFGEKLGPAGIVSGNFPYRAELAGTSIQIAAAGGARMSAFPLYVSAGQIGFVIPSNMPLGAAQVTVTAEGRASNAVPVDIVRRSFGTFTINQGGSGPAIIQNFETQTDQPLNSILRPARPGQVVTLWGTGLGPVSGDEASAPQPGDLAMTFTVRVGFQNARVLYKGRSGCCAGVDQVVFEVPQGIEGCYVPVVIVAGEPNRATVNLPDEGPISNTATMSISASGPCQDPTGLTGPQITSLFSTGSVRTAAVTVERSVRNEPTKFEASFRTVDTLAAFRSLGIMGLPPVGTCLDVVPELASPVGIALNVGTLALRGPSGTTMIAAPYSASPDLPAGDYELSNGEGTPEVGGFHVPFRFPAPITWTNRSANLGSQQHTFQWTGGDADGLVIITGRAATRVAAGNFVCVARASAGSFTFPAPEWFQGLREGFGYAPLTIIVTLSSAGAPVRFSARGLDAGVLISKVSDSRTY